MDERTAEWLALLFDTEGNFSLNKAHYKPQYHSRPARRGFSWAFKMGVTNTDETLLKEAQVRSGERGRVTPTGSKSYRPENKQQYRWLFRREESVELIPHLLPHLIVKPDRALLYLQACQSMDICKGLGTNPVTPLRDRRLETIFWELRKLNAKNRNGAENVVIEEREAGHVPYSQEEWLADAERVRADQDRVAYENKLQRSRDWKRRNKAKMAVYWKEYSARQKASA